MQAAVHKKTIIGVTALVLITVLSFWWNINSTKLAAQARAILLSQVNQALNGRLEAADIEISISKVVIRQAVIFDQQNAEVAKCERIIMAYGFRDFFTGRIGIDAVKDITLDAPALTLVQAKEGQWNINTLVKPASPGKTKYRGPIHIKKGTAVLTTPVETVSIENLQAALTVDDQLLLAIQQGTLLYAGQKVMIKGQIEDLTGAQNLNLEGTAKDFDLSAIAQDLPLQAKCNINTQVAGTGNQPVIKGTLDIPAGTLNKTAFQRVKGAFQYIDGILSLEQVEADILGGKGQLAGTVQLKQPPQLKLYVNIYGVDSAQLADDIAMSGIGNYYTVIEGPPDRPTIAGKFDIAQGIVRNVPFTAARGSFRLTDNVLYIEQTEAAAMGGSVAATGTVQLAGSNGYRLQVSGHGLDIGRLVDASKPPSVKSAPPAIAGSVSLEADVTGATIIQSAAGTFSMPAGTFADTTFANARGAFRYDGQKLIFDHARAEVNGGIVSGSGTLGIEREEYVLTLAGSGLESGQLTNKQVQGKLAFDANAQGTGDLQSAVVRGSFRMGSGTVSGIPFTSAQGSFTRQAGQYRFDAVNFQMLGGLIQGDIAVNGNSFAVKVQTPQGTVETTERQLLEKALENVIKKQDKPANQPAESTSDAAANTATDKNTQTKDQLPDDAATILDLLKRLKEKTR